MKPDDSFDTFYRKYKDRIFAYLFRLTGDYQQSLDVMQESFTRYFSRYRHREKSHALLHVIARNTALDNLRKRKEGPITCDIGASGAESPEARLIEKQRTLKIKNAVYRLEPMDRQLIEMVSQKKMTYREMGKQLGLSEGNVKVKVHRARLRLKTMFENGGA